MGPDLRTRLARAVREPLPSAGSTNAPAILAVPAASVEIGKVRSCSSKATLKHPASSATASLSRRWFPSAHLQAKTLGTQTTPHVSGAEQSMTSRRACASGITRCRTLPTDRKARKVADSSFPGTFSAHRPAPFPFPVPTPLPPPRTPANCCGRFPASAGVWLLAELVEAGEVRRSSGGRSGLRVCSDFAATGPSAPHPRSCWGLPAALRFPWVLPGPPAGSSWRRDSARPGRHCVARSSLISPAAVAPSGPVPGSPVLSGALSLARMPRTAGMTSFLAPRLGLAHRPPASLRSGGQACSAGPGLQVKLFSRVETWSACA